MSDTLRAGVELLKLSWRASPGKLLLAMVLMLIQAVAMPLAAPALAALVTAVVSGDTAGAAIAAAVVAALAVAALTAGHFAHVFYYELGERNFLDMDCELVALANGSAGLDHHERPEYADRLQVLRQEMDRVSWTSMSALLSSVSLGVAMVITAILLGVLNPWLLLLPLAAVPPLVAGRRAEALTERARTDTAAEQRRGRHIFALATDAGPAKELRVCGVGDELRRRHFSGWRAVTAVLWRAEARAAALRVGGQLVFAAVYVGATLVVVRAVVAGRGGIGDVVLVIALASQVNQQVTSAVTLLQELQRLAGTLRSFRWMGAVVERPTSVPEDASVPGLLHEGVRLREVSFRYPGTDRPVLAGVDLMLPAGSTVAIVGENGAGKTTLVKLLCRFYEPTGGVVELDGVDLRRFPLSAWRERISAGFQDFARFEFLAREVVGVGDLRAIGSTEAVTAALRRAHAEGILDRLDDGLETPLGVSLPNGTQLSSGQWQKLALGRAMMRESPLLLILDEPTSALDAQAEHDLFEQYAAGAARVGARTGAITVLVSHRFSTVGMADVILVVADGRITETGDHDTLMAAGGLYAELYGMQAAAYR